VRREWPASEQLYDPTPILRSKPGAKAEPKQEGGEKAA